VKEVAQQHRLFGHVQFQSRFKAVSLVSGQKQESSAAGASWATVAAGAVVSCALTLVLLAVGVGLGLSVVSGRAAPGWTITASFRTLYPNWRCKSVRVAALRGVGRAMVPRLEDMFRSDRRCAGQGGASPDVAFAANRAS
jgi:hypothetical protein